MGDNNLSSAVDGNIITAASVNQYKTSLSGDLYPRASDGTINTQTSSMGQDSYRFKDVHSHGVVYNKGVKLLPAGMMVPFAGSSVPTDWLLCNGDTIGNAASGATHAGAEYEDLFDVVKAAWGNTGAEVFADDDTVVIPDFTNGEFIRGVGGDSAALSVSQAGQNASHTHGQRYSGHDTTNFQTGDAYIATSFGGSSAYASTSLAAISTVSGRLNTSSSGGAEVRPLNKAVNFLIRI